MTDRKWENYSEIDVRTHIEKPLDASAPTWLTENGINSGPGVKLGKHQSNTHKHFPSCQGAGSGPLACLILFVCSLDKRLQVQINLFLNNSVRE